MNTETKTNLQSKNTWVRVLYMLLFVLAYSAAEFVLGITVVIQVIIKLVTGELNERLKTFGNQISLYIFDVLKFLTFNSEDKPFPFDEWPTGEK
ncbi:DUF4389 domain-containing protein [Cocleimonas sp. KMM 6892]|uniref:DUF4389 domain-containing protein n=1 Tax=unclassified Cocleimonas TaxID=2639732 RepID=UPI002DBC7CAB|nr:MULTISPECIES: DUF4389 domain-containing protein [unclassified Cocleimonas]MEB8433261.1 DUF4389 domain-containing protein [Cocleimonas sp. KMM 6892]MEC4715758.1 DUF4389 domain-containing protein [Cocleimonas sp. KMM 6895]MEC4745219.1 DUF4389 domain-containing protein [Cocleimonas sp. KMM 6896]